MVKTTHVIRGHSEREVELKVLNFISVRDQVHDEDWVADSIEYHPARLFNYKPFVCHLHRLEDEL